MTTLIASASVPVFTHMLNNLKHILDKAQTFIEAKGCEPAAITQFRLAPDMLPFTRQILIACDGAKFGTMRLSGVEAPKFADDEQTIADLKIRIQKTLDYLATVPASAFDGADHKEITFPVGREATRTMKGEDYLNLWVLPNFYFHITMAYAILRHTGVPLGKMDYLAGSRV